MSEPKRYELSLEQWRRIRDLLPGKPGDPGRSGADNRLFREWGAVGASVGRALARPAGALWQMEDRAQALHALGEGGVWERVFDNLIDDQDNQYLMLDLSLVRAHQQAATGKGGGQKGATRLWGVPEED